MQISRLVTSHHRLPLTPPFVASWDGRPRTHYDLALLQVETDAGITGVSSCGANADIQAHADLFIGQDPLDRERHFQIVENLSLHYGRCWTVDVALWDIVGQVMQQPCWRVLGLSLIHI